ncbi:hypothetical protein JST97_36700 [bacterium]|nr:hypothetical protein [bacterium]
MDILARFTRSMRGQTGEWVLNVLHPLTFYLLLLLIAVVCLGSAWAAWLGVSRFVGPAIFSPAVAFFVLRAVSGVKISAEPGFLRTRRTGLTFPSEQVIPSQELARAFVQEVGTYRDGPIYQLWAELRSGAKVTLCANEMVEYNSLSEVAQDINDYYGLKV